MNVVFYDGQCGFCDGTVRFLLRIDRRKTLSFSPLQGELAASLNITSNSGNSLETIIFLVDEPGAPLRIFRKSDASIEISKTIGGVWRVVAMGRLIPVQIRDALYDWVADNRYKWFERFPQCKNPTNDVKHRFIP